MAVIADDSKERFSDRVADYVRARPSYPKAVYEFLRDELKLTPRSIIADVGSGTGISTRPLLENGNTVYAIEPNAAMRAAAEESLFRFAGFRSVDASAEKTTLVDRTVDLVICAQAFHWFDPALASKEFARILKPDGYAVLVWNERQLDSTSFMRDYEKFLDTFGTDYRKTRHEIVTANIEMFFSPGGYSIRTFENRQTFDYPGLEARVLSSSYTPRANDPRRQPMLAELRRLFDLRIQSGDVSFEYDTRVYFGQLA